ncbi:MAG: hypothetical protein Q8R18_05530 [bacterium]|nr:hypothetical protein [bacterium]
MIASAASWRELHNYVSTLKEQNLQWKIWDDFLEPDKYCIDFLVKTNWLVEKGFPMSLGEVTFDKKIIYREDLKTKERDITICHELAHVFYPAKSYQQNISNINWECIIEWIGRRWRAKPEVLKEIIEGFHIQPRVYDRITQRAFPKQTRRYRNQGYTQLKLPLE